MVTCLYHAFPSFNCRLCVAYLRVAIINKGPLVTVMIRGMRRPDNARWNKTSVSANNNSGEHLVTSGKWICFLLSIVVGSVRG